MQPLYQKLWLSVVLLTELRDKQDRKTDSYPFLGRWGAYHLRRAIALKDLSTRYPIIELRTCIYGVIDHDNYRVAQDSRYLAIKFLAVNRAHWTGRSLIGRQRNRIKYYILRSN